VIPVLRTLIEASSYSEALFDRVPDVVFFIKDRECRYVMVNQTLVDRCGKRSKVDLLGKTTRSVFPPPLGERFFEQDRRVLHTGIAISQNLEMHLYPTRLEGWCLTEKIPIPGSDGRVVGLAGISRDLHSPGRETDHFAEVAAALEHVRSDYGSDLRVQDLAEVSGLSVYQLNRRLRAIFGITAGQFITKQRIDAASEMLRRNSDPIAEIAVTCGYFDQSAFSRVFRRTVGLTPRQYRARHQFR
jgi:AraC-like DNA-binding protein